MEYNILFIQQNVPGGALTAIKRLYTEFSDSFPNSSCDYKIIDNFTESSVRFSFLKRILEYYFTSRKVIKKFIKSKNYNYFITSDYLIALAFYSLKTKETKLVFAFHGLKSVLFKKTSDISFRQLVIKILERLAWILSDLITTPSLEAQNYILKTTLLLKKSKIKIINNIVPGNFFRAKKLFRKSKSLRLIYSGRIAKQKGLENLISGFIKLKTKIPEIKLTIAYITTDIDKSLYNGIWSSIKKYNLEKNIKLIPDSSDDNLTKLYANSDLLVLPTELEFAPLSIIEAMAAGTPVVGTKVGNLERLLSRLDKVLILNNNSSDEIFKKIITFSNYPLKTRMVLSSKARKIAKVYRSEFILTKFKRVLDDI